VANLRHTCYEKAVRARVASSLGIAAAAIPLALLVAAGGCAGKGAGAALPTPVSGAPVSDPPEAYPANPWCLLYLSVIDNGNITIWLKNDGRVSAFYDPSPFTKRPKGGCKLVLPAAQTAGLHRLLVESRAPSPSDAAAPSDPGPAEPLSPGEQTLLVGEAERCEVNEIRFTGSYRFHQIPSGFKPFQREMDRLAEKVLTCLKP
jgi:hypothetical protein